MIITWISILEVSVGLCSACWPRRQHMRPRVEIISLDWSTLTLVDQSPRDIARHPHVERHRITDSQFVRVLDSLLLKARPDDTLKSIDSRVLCLIRRGNNRRPDTLALGGPLTMYYHRHYYRISKSVLTLVATKLSAQHQASIRKFLEANSRFLGD
jgi:hypothetical protein